VSLRARLVSGNEHKLAELRAALPGWRIELVDADDLPSETGATYLENARLKARFGREHAGADEWALGEDSGIEAIALGGRPGIASARWAQNFVERLLNELDVHQERGARYVCALVAIGPDGQEVAATGTLEGTVERERRGDEGFGYDPVFVPLGETLTVAELGNAWKREHSHRARAAAALAQELATTR
jgi:XTP/dITP diphosphohydrolase